MYRGGTRGTVGGQPRTRHAPGQLDRRFDQVESRFDQVESRFDQVESRFDQVDRRFDHSSPGSRVKTNKQGQAQQWESFYDRLHTQFAHAEQTILFSRRRAGFKTSLKPRTNVARNRNSTWPLMFGLFKSGTGT